MPGRVGSTTGHSHLSQEHAMTYTPPKPPPPVPELLRQAAQRLNELADRADQIASTGANCCHDSHIAAALAPARQVLEIGSHARSQ